MKDEGGELLVSWTPGLADPGTRTHKSRRSGSTQEGYRQIERFWTYRTLYLGNCAR